MAKNPRRQPQSPKTTQPVVEKKPLLSQRGKKVIALGVGLVVAGYGILTLTDPAGQNWASTVSPLLLVLGYGLIGVGLVLADPAPSAPDSALPPA